MTTITAGKRSSSIIVTHDGTEIYYKDWGEGPVVTFSHGWPLNADAWDGQMLFLAQNGFRVDRARPARPWPVQPGLVGQRHERLRRRSRGRDRGARSQRRHAGGPLHRRRRGRALHRPPRHGARRQGGPDRRRAADHAARRAANPEGLPIEVFDGLRAGLVEDRSQFYKDFAIPFYGANRPGAKVSQGMLDQFWLWSMQAGLKNAYECIKAFSETDFTEDLKKFDVPTLVLHGEDDQIVPVKDSAMKSARLIKGAKDIYYPGAPHGITATHQDQVNADLLAFLQSSPDVRRRPQRRLTMKIVVIGGTGLIGSKLVDQASRARPRGGAGIAGHGRQHAHGRGTGRSPRRAPLSSSTCRTRRRSRTRRCSSSSRRRRATSSPPKRRRAWAITSRCRSWAPTGCSESGYFRAKIAQEKLIRGVVDPVLDRPRDAVLRVRQEHRRRRDRRRHGAPRTRAVPADRGRGRRERGWQGRRWDRR